MRNKFAIPLPVILCCDMKFRKRNATLVTQNPATKSGSDDKFGGKIAMTLPALYDIDEGKKKVLAPCVLESAAVD